MNKKIFVSIVALGAIVAGSATAANMSEASCKKSSKYIWVSGAIASDGGHGVCIKKNPCKDSDYKNFCDKRFDNIQVCTKNVALTLVRRAGSCTNSYSLDVDNLMKQDYVACEWVDRDGMQYRVFEFDDTNETFDGTCANGGFKGACIAMGGDVQDFQDKIVCNMNNDRHISFDKNSRSVYGSDLSDEATAFFKYIINMKNY